MKKYIVRLTEGRAARRCGSSGGHEKVRRAQILQADADGPNGRTGASEA